MPRTNKKSFRSYLAYTLVAALLGLALYALRYELVMAQFEKARTVSLIIPSST
jgi:hypothetical protein